MTRRLRNALLGWGALIMTCVSCQASQTMFWRSDPVCGNAVVEAGEQCDQGDENSATEPDTCRPDCLRARCGDAVRDIGEACDDGNQTAGDGCSPNCALEACGNGVLDAGEVCDDGGNLSGDGCSADCHSDESCGNGHTDPVAGEVCDDGNHNNGDGCSADCRSTESCGNARIDLAVGEVCDDGNHTGGDGCSADCRSNETCGNGSVDWQAGEVCDDGNHAGGDGCSADCRSNETCGNGVADWLVNEVCDDGNQSGGDGCSADCRSDETCGNGSVDWESGEVCDDGNLAGGDGCRGDCLSDEACGNGLLDLAAGEVCDDGSHLDGDGCSADCRSDETCGNSLTDLTVGELCDDGATNSIGPNAACRPDCQPGRCGDGIVDSASGELCDGSELAGQTCASLAHDSGTLGCRSDCLFDEAACISCPLGLSACGGSCVDLDQNAAHCGGCAIACGSIEICVTGSCQLWCGGGPCVGGTHLWSQLFGVSWTMYSVDVTVDGTGQAILVGHFAGNADFGGGPLTSAGGYDAFVATFDNNGNHLWSQRFGASGDQYATRVSTDATGNIFVAGLFTGAVDFGGGLLTSAGGADVFLVKLSPDGSHLWSQSYGDASGQNITDMAVDADGQIALLGWFDGTIDFGGGLLNSSWQDAYLATFSPDGQHRWSKSFPVLNSQGYGGVALDRSGKVIITGVFAGTVDFGGSPLTSLDFDIFLATFDSGGQHLWSQNFGREAMVKGITVNSRDEIVIVGNSWATVDFGGDLLIGTGSSDIIMASFTAGGQHLWSQKLPVDTWAYTLDLDVDSYDNVVVTGRFRGAVDLGGSPFNSVDEDILLAKYDSSGRHLWSRQFGDTGHQRGARLALDPFDNIVLTGGASVGVDLGGGWLQSAGSYDMLLAKFAPW